MSFPCRGRFILATPPVRGLGFLMRRRKTVPVKRDDQRCPNETCPRPQTPKKRSLWRGLFEAPPEIRKPPPLTCRVKIAQDRAAEDPDLSCIPGQPYRTCGEAFVVQQDRLPEAPAARADRERDLLGSIEAHPDLKDRLRDPMPPFRSVEQRLLDLSERRLHPHYKLHRSVPKKTARGFSCAKARGMYRTRSGPVSVDDVPKRLKFNRKLMEEKNLFADLKRVEPPEQLLARVVEMEENYQRGMLKRGKEVKAADGGRKNEKQRPHA